LLASKWTEDSGSRLSLTAVQQDNAASIQLPFRNLST